MIFLASTIAVPASLLFFVILGILFAFIIFFEGGKNDSLYHNNYGYYNGYEHPQQYYQNQHPYAPRPYWTPQSPDYELRARRRNPIGTLFAILLVGAILALFFMMPSNKAQTTPENTEQSRDSLTKVDVMDEFSVLGKEEPTFKFDTENRVEPSDSQYWDNEYVYYEYENPVTYKKLTPKLLWVARFTVQAGFFGVADNAVNISNRLRQSFPNRQVWIETGVNDLAQKGYYVFVGEFVDEAAAKSFSNALKKQGFEEGMIVPLVVQ
jgi:hypothetical protein